MNPIVHGEIAWLLSQKLRARRDRILVVAAGLAPDIDGLTLLGGTEMYAKYHHLVFHGFAAAVLTTAVCAAFAKQRALVAALAFAAFHVHIGCDLLGSGPGWPIWYYWPVNRTEWFWDGQWDLASWQNTTIGLTATILCLLCALPFRRTPVEIFSLNADAKVVETLRKRFGKKD